MKVIVTESQFKLLTESLNFSEVYKQTFPSVFSFICMKYANGDYDLAQEYCQTGFIRVNQKLNTFSGEGSIGSWVSKVVKNEIINLLREKVRKIDTDKNVDVEKVNVAEPEVEKENEIEYMGKYSKKLIHKAIESLADGYKVIFYNFFFKDKSHKEIADMLGISEGTSRSQLAKAKNIVKKFLEQHA